MKKNIVTILFGLIILTAVILRFYQLGIVPPSPNWDEVALGYDAYSIGLTGKDEYGKFLPVVLRSFDDYKPALYSYLIIPFVFTIGLTTIAVRLPSAIFGVIGVIAAFYLVRTLFENYKHRDPLALLSGFLMAISPWSIQFSRVGFESNVGSTLNILAALFFIKGLKNPILLSLSAIFAALSIYVYQSEKVFTPLLVLILIGVYFKPLFKLPRKFLVSAFVVGSIVIAPMVINILTDPSTLLRARGTSIFAKQTQLLERNIERLEADRQNNDILGIVLDNRRILYGQHIIGGYLAHFDPNWLFIKGDIGRHHAPGMGMLYLFELPFILFGIYLLIFSSFNIRTKLVLFLWFAAVPIPASITSEVPHAVRTLNFLPTWQIFAALGLITAYISVLGIKYRVFGMKVYKLIITGFLLFAIFNFIYYLNQYFVQLNYYTSHEWQYGYREAVDYVREVEGKYDRILVSDKQPMDKSYMFFLFYLKYPPIEYQKIGKDSAGGYWAQHHFGKFEFRPLDFEKDSKQPRTLLIGTPDEIPDDSKILKRINNLDGTPAIEIAQT